MADDKQTGKVIAEEVKKGMEKVTGEITGPIKSFFPSLISQIPTADSFLKVAKSLAPKKENAGKLVEEEREKANRQKEQTILLERMANSLDGLSNGISNLSPEKVGMGLLAPIGVIGAVVSGFVSGFVGEIKKQFTALKGIFGGFKNILVTIGDSFKGSVKFLDDVIDFLVKDTFMEGGATKIKNFFSTKLKSLFTNVTKITDSIVDVATKGLEPITNIVTRIKNFFSTNLAAALRPIANTIDTITDTVNNALEPVKNIVTRIKTFFSSTFLNGITKITDTFTNVVNVADDGRSSAIAEKFKSLVKGIKDYFGRFGPIFDDFINAVRTSVKAADDAGGIVGKIIGFARGFGQVLGKIFLPITILMSAFDFITGFMDGYSEEGIIGGMREGLAKLFANLIGAPLDLLKGAVGWVLGMFGFDKAKEQLASFSFTELIGDLVRLPFNMISGAVDWVKTLFTDPKQALTDLWNGIVGEGGLIQLMFKPIDMAIAWVQGVFKFGDPENPFSLGEVISGALKSIGEFFGGIFDIDIKSMAKSILPDKLVDWFFGDDDPSNMSSEEKEARRAEIEREKQEAADRIARSNQGEDMYWGRDSKGRMEDAEKIEKLNRELQALGPKPKPIDTNRIHFGPMADGNYAYFRRDASGGIHVLTNQGRAKKLYEQQNNIDDALFERKSGGQTVIVRQGDSPIITGGSGRGKQLVPIADNSTSNWNGSDF